jgi:hypothetical protein
MVTGQGTTTLREFTKYLIHWTYHWLAPNGVSMWSQHFDDEAEAKSALENGKIEWDKDRPECLECGFPGQSDDREFDPAAPIEFEIWRPKD